MGNEGAVCVGRLGVNSPLRVIRREALLEIIKGILVVVILFAATVTWSQAQVTDESNLPENAQQSSTSQSNPAPAPPTDSGKPEQAPPPQEKKDDTEGQQTKRMFWVVPNFG